MCNKKSTTKFTKLTQNMYVQKCFCLEETACYHAKSTEEKENGNMRYQKHLLNYILPVFFLRQKKICSKGNRKTKNTGT